MHWRSSSSRISSLVKLFLLASKSLMSFIGYTCSCVSLIAFGLDFVLNFSSNILASITVIGQPPADRTS